MERKISLRKIIFVSLSYILVAAVAAVITLLLWAPKYSKLAELEAIIDERFIGEYDKTAVEDAAAESMVDALSDRWSSYFTVEEYAAQQESASNSYVGIGVTVKTREDGTGEDVLEVLPGGPAQEGGVLPGDVIVKVDGQSIGETDGADVRSLILGEPGTKVSITVLRDGDEMEFSLERRKIKVTVASGQLLEGSVGLVQISNFNSDCGEQTIAVIEDLLNQGATSLIFDVRNNPGGYVNEMTDVLDYLLPKCVLFRDVDYKGREGVIYSDDACVELPMAVLVNGDSYSAAEFFAACLREYDKATVVGQQTCGKGYFQNTIRLSDGSAVNLSVGKYFTPNGVSLTEVGGLTPDIPVEVDDETAALIYAKLIDPAEDIQLQAAVQALAENAG